MQINNIAELKASLRNGKYAWPGGYTVFYLCYDGEPLCFDCVKKEIRKVFYSMMHEVYDGWHIYGADLRDHYGDPIICDHCGHEV